MKNLQYSLCGIDEAGRGCLAGPLVVAGVELLESIEGLFDSKQLSEKKREELFEIITQKSRYKILFFDNDIIDEKGLSFCLGSAISQIKESLKNCNSFLMDGNSSFGVQGVKTMIKADTKIPQVSAASILAKVSRDHYMYEKASEYPQYSFTKHKGYGTALHVKQIKEHGYSDLHRKSFKIKALTHPTLF